MCLYFILFSLFALGNCGVIGDGGSSNYVDCKNIDSSVKEHCEDYEEKFCTFINREKCNDVPVQSCRAIVSTHQERKCFNVTEELCMLKEEVVFENIKVPLVVQRCQKSNERICDTLYEIERDSKDVKKCVTIENTKCRTIEKTLYDKSCRNVVKFNCKELEKNGYYIYGSKEPVCEKKFEEKCYETPRTVLLPECERIEQEVCENLRDFKPFVLPRQSCRNEIKRTCTLEERTQTKQVKNFSYRTICRPVPREVCQVFSRDDLQKSCVPSVHKNCYFTEEQNCGVEPKQYCFQYSVYDQNCSY